MTSSQGTALIAIKAVHSAVFMVMLTAIGWLVGTGLAGRRDRSVAVAASLVAAESIVFVANRGVCPLTPLAERHGASHGGVSDIFLPDALARTIPIWASSLVVAAVLLHLRGAVRSPSSAMRVPGISHAGKSHHAGKWNLRGRRTNETPPACRRGREGRD